ncbi:HNH endonuclease [Sinorhizobium phage phiM7]|uniref:HNH endonuclease n=2 Tax=Emdodecavirus TaxID=1980937 RepID=A0A0F6YQ55_9CAUD|nr:HNH endonuclease [Sinorhizobium phage phiN3]YP_009601322.1 HNH endonuclease [Sinorhizobium phage phiM7]AKF12742.1 HNH endonuclease [Sinorhizobium phage phiM7]AKF13102.1 HNH endonuclease [Sinorhizobium phage phiM19]AKF13472.1 HNH endonuclease [Sinorhizobium phage phiN3]
MPTCEIWKPVTGFELYEVSNHGRIRNLKSNKILKTSVRDRYVRVNLYQNGTSKTVLVHRLVAEVFLPNHDSFANDVNHIDGNKANNHVSNLEWTTREENIRHSWDTGLRVVIGQKLTTSDVKEIKELYSSGNYSQKNLAKAYGVHQSNISRIVNDKCFLTN